MGKWKAGNSLSTHRLITHQFSSEVLLSNVSSQAELPDLRRSRYLSETAKYALQPKTVLKPRESEHKDQLGKGFSLLQSLFPADIVTEDRDLHSKASYRASNHLTVRPKLSPAGLLSPPVETLDQSNPSITTVKVASSPQRRLLKPLKKSVILQGVEDEVSVRHTLTYPLETKKHLQSPHSHTRGKRIVTVKQHPGLFTGSLPYILGGALVESK